MTSDDVTTYELRGEPVAFVLDSANHITKFILPPDLRWRDAFYLRDECESFQKGWNAAVDWKWEPKEQRS